MLARSQSPILFFAPVHAAGTFPFSTGSPFSEQETSGIYNDDGGINEHTALFLEDWVGLAASMPNLIQQMMSSPYNPRVLKGLKEAAAASRPGQVEMFPEKASLSNLIAERKSANITGMMVDEVAKFFPPASRIDEGYLGISYRADTGFYRVEFLPELNGDADFGLLSGAAKLSLLDEGEWSAVKQVFSDRRTADFITRGGLFMLIPAMSVIAVPRIIGMTQNEGVINLWTPHAGQQRPEGSPIKLYHSQQVRERFAVGDMIDKIMNEIARAKNAGREPAIALDLDGTIFDARRFTTKIFLEWMENYEGPFNGQLRRAIRKIGDVTGWNSEVIVRSIFKGIGIVLPDDLDGSSGKTSGRMKHAIEAVLSAKKHFQRNFFDPKRRVDEMEIIPGTVEFVKAIQSMGVRTFFVTLRDNKDDDLGGGRSSSIESLKKYGLWVDGSSVLIRYEPETEDERIDWTTYAKIKTGTVKEPNKAEMVRRYIRKHAPSIWFIGIFDNDPKHVESYQSAFNTMVFHVEGDIPPGSRETTPEGSLAVSPAQMCSGIKEWQRQTALKEMMLKQAWDDLRRQYNTAIADGKNPVVFLGLKDTLFTMSPQPEPIPGAAEFVNALHSLGIHIRYLTSRLEGDSYNGMLEVLKRFGFPVPGSSGHRVKLIMRRDPEEPKALFKARMQSLVLDRIGGARLVAAFDNEPSTLVNYRRSFPKTALYLVGGVSGSRDIEKYSLIPIVDFMGEISAIPSAADIHAMMLRLRGAYFELMGPFGYDHEDKIRLEVASIAKEIAKKLSTLTRININHPAHAAFIDEINATYADKPGGLEELIDILNLVNYYTGSRFVIIRGPKGIRYILSADGDSVPADMIVSPAPRDLNLSPISLPAGRVGLDTIQKTLSDMPDDYELGALGREELYELLPFGNYPRMNAVLGGVVGAVMAATGKDVGGILAVEYGPRRALAPLLALSRMGVQAAWREITFARFETVTELERIPSDIRPNIRYLPEEESANPDIAVWNYPPTLIAGNLDKLGWELSSGGLLVVQSDTTPEYGLKNWDLAVNITLAPGSYVFPSAYHYLGMNKPARFMVWRKR